MSGDALTFRTAEDRDLDRLIEIHTAAFPDPRGYEARHRNFVANALGGFESLHVACKNDVVVAHAFFFPLGAWFGGKCVKAGAVATVGVAPEARGQSVGSKLLAHLHDVGDARGDAISLLYPFRQEFYARHGYVSVSPTKRLSFSPRAIPESFGSTNGIRTANGDDMAAILAAYDRAAASTTGWIARPSSFWEKRFADERRAVFVVIRDGACAGYIAWSVEQSESHAVTHLRVEELVAIDHDARRALFALLRSQRDQVTDITLDVAAHDPIDRILLDADRARFGTKSLEHPLGIVAGGPMVRITNVERAIASRGYVASGSIDVEVNDTPLRITVTDGAASVERTARVAPRLVVTRESLASILYGTLSASDAARFGLASGDAETLALADALFSLPPFFALDRF
jgi:predicted acetyltransferase